MLCYFSFKLLPNTNVENLTLFTFKTWWSSPGLVMMSGSLTCFVPAASLLFQDVLLPWCQVQDVSWQQHPHGLVWSVVGPMKSVGLRGSQGHDFMPDSNTPIAKEGMRMVPRRHLRVRRLTESLQGWTPFIHVGLWGWQGQRKIIWIEVDAARCQEPPCFQSWWPSVTAFEHACAAAPWFVLVLQAVSTNIQSSSNIRRLNTTIPFISERRRGSMVVHI